LTHNDEKEKLVQQIKEILREHLQGKIVGQVTPEDLVTIRKSLERVLPLPPPPNVEVEVFLETAPTNGFVCKIVYSPDGLED